MRRLRTLAVILSVVLYFGSNRTSFALEKPDTIYKIFQFPANKIPRIDGDPEDWSIVPDDYIIGSDQTARDNWSGQKPDPKHLDVKIKIGWVKGLNRLYFLYEGTKDYWDFDKAALTNDIFELAVDGDRSGGPFLARFHPATQPTSGRGTPTEPPEHPASDIYINARDAFYNFQGNSAQNYHIFTPAEGKDWCMAFGPQAAWIKKLPYSNVAYNYNFKSGQGGKVIMELMITPFDYAGADGPPRAVESELYENKIIGMSWAFIDRTAAGRQDFWNLSPKHTMYGQASELCAFKLMPLEEKLQKPIDAQWSFKVVDLDQRIIAFHDESVGKVTTWKWDFGDNTTSTDQNPIHTYAKTGAYVVTLYIDGPAGQSRMCKVWDVTLH